MDLLKLLSGSGLFMLLGLFVVGIVLFNKIKNNRYHHSTKKKKR